MTKATDSVVATWQRIWQSIASAVIIGTMFWMSSTMMDLDKRVYLMQSQIPEIVSVREQMAQMNLRLHVCESKCGGLQ